VSRLGQVEAGDVFRYRGELHVAIGGARPARAAGYVVVQTAGEGWSQVSGHKDDPVEIVVAGESHM
jgi:hypothetical protein